MATKTVLEIYKLLCPTISMAKPQVVFTSTDNSIIKLTGLLNEALGELQGEYDWQFMRREYALTTADGVDSYDFPTDIDRFLSGTFFDRNSRWEVGGSLTPSQWQGTQALRPGLPFSRFTVTGNKLKFYPVPGPSPITFTFEYISNAVAKSSGGEVKPEITEDSDVILFDHRVVIALLKLKWLTSLKQDTTSATDDYDDALSKAKSNDAPRMVISAEGNRTASPYIGMHNFPEYSP